MKNIVVSKTAKAFLCFCCFFLITNSLYSQDSSFTLVFVDADSGLPIKNLTCKYSTGGENNRSDSELLTFTSDVTDALGELTVPSNASVVKTSSILYGNQDLGDFTNHGPYYLKKTAYQLSSSEVVGYSNKQKLQLQPAAISFIETAQLDQDQGASIQNQLNNQPGIQMESRGYGGSRRLSIRGSFIRSPFAVRNIKMYYNGVPITSPDGSSPFEMIDPSELSSVEVIKGPAGGLYGSGNGGAMLFNSKRGLSETTSIDHSTTLGSFAYLRSSTAVGAAYGKWNVRASFQHQETEGYRKQEWNWKNQSNFSLQHNTSNKVQLGLHFIDYHGRWALPGSIKWEDAQEDPTQANANSEDLNAHVRRNRKWVALTGSYTSRHWKNSTSVYYTDTDKSNAFGTSPFFKGFKEEGGDGYGMRTEFSTQVNKENFNLDVKLGGEYQTDENKLDQYDNVFGKPGDFEFTNTTTSNNALAFLNTRIAFGAEKQWIAEVGVTLNQLDYNSNGFSVDVSKIDTSATYTSALPRLALMRKTDKLGSFYINFSQGNSPPSIFELIDPESGDFAENLNPEEAWNLEFGSRNTMGNGWLTYDLSVYNSELTNAIFPKTDSTGLTLFTNEGVIRSRGIEGLIQFTLIQKPNSDGRSRLIQSMNYTVGLQYQDQQFKNIPFGDEVFTDKQVPGVAKWKTSQQLNVRTSFGLSIQAQHQWLDQVAFDNANTTFSPAYHLLNAKVNYRLPIKSEKIFIDLFAGGNNLTDAFYMDFLQVNGVFGRLYNPAPERNYYGGMRLKAFL